MSLSLVSVLSRTRPPPILSCYPRRVPQLIPHFRCQLSFTQSLLPRRSFSATPWARYARPSSTLKSDTKPEKEANVSADARERPTLHENIYTIPNLLTASRILACPVLGWSILHDDFYLATGLLVYAGLSDIVSHPS